MAHRIYLIRHAEAFEKYVHQTDFERELTTKGANDAKELGYHLAKLTIKFDALFCSPAVRTKATAQLIAGGISYPVEQIATHRELYQAATEDFLKVTATISNNSKSIAIVGHNPAISQFATWLAKTSVDNFSPCTIAAFHLHIKEWRDLRPQTGLLEFVHFPTIL